MSEGNNPELEALVEKNKELLAELKKVKADLRKVQDIKPEDYQAVVDELESVKEKLSATEKGLKTANSEAEKFKGLYESESAHTAKTLIDSGLTNALVDAKVDAKYLKAVKALIGGDAKVETDGDKRIVKIGDKALGDYIKEWSATDEAKHYISAPVNSGGGAGGGKAAQSKTMPRADFESSTPAERSAFIGSGGAISD